MIPGGGALGPSLDEDVAEDETGGVVASREGDAFAWMSLLSSPPPRRIIDVWNGLLCLV